VARVSEEEVDRVVEGLNEIIGYDSSLVV